MMKKKKSTDRGFYIEQRGQGFRCQVRYKGAVVSETFAVERLARIWGRARVVEIEQGYAVGKPATVTGTVANMIDAYIKTMYPIQRWSPTKEYGLQQLHKDLGHLMVAKLDTQAVVDYALSLRVYPGTTEPRLGAPGIKSRIYYLVEVVDTAKSMINGYKAAPIDEVREAVRRLTENGVIGKGKPRTVRPTPAQIAAIKANVSTHELARVDLAAIIEVLQYLPIRVGELCKIRWDDINHERKTVTLRARKHSNPVKKQTNDEEIVLPTVFGVDTYKLIADRPRHIGDGPFPYTDAPDWETTAVSNAFYHARSRAQVKDVHLHDLRAHGISAMLAAKVPLNVVAKISGHKDYKVLQEHYDRMTLDEIREVIEDCCKTSGMKMTPELLAEVPKPFGHNGGPDLEVV
jgi:integrase